jgi:hypothetical protein
MARVARLCGLISQGEVNALALSVFLPRARLPASPFRFVMIDDRVQAMDRAEVDGLPRVLEKGATDRQSLPAVPELTAPNACANGQA